MRGRGAKGVEEESGGRVPRKYEEIWDDGYYCGFEFSMTMDSHHITK